MMARVSLTILGLLILWAAVAGQSVRETPTSIDPNASDYYLYVTITERMASGESYYEAAINEQVKRGYPIAPASTVRLPTTATLINALGNTRAYAVMVSLMILVLVGALIRFERLSSNRMQWWGSIFFLGIAMAPFSSGAIYFQETWAVLLMFLSLTMAKRSTLLAVALALCAFAFRELALPFMAAMMTYEFLHHRIRQTLIWFSAILIALVGYSVHIFVLNNAIVDASLTVYGTSSGWLSFGGWPFVVGSVRSTTLLSAFPLSLSIVLVPLALLGWIMRKDKFALRVSFAILGFMIPFLFIGRPNNNYWGLLYALFLLPGLAFSWQGLKSLIVTATNRQKDDRRSKTEEAAQN